MNITSEKKDDLNLVLTVDVAAADYAEQRRKKLANMQKMAQIPGFRKGKVPASIIEKFYGESTLGECVNSVVGDALQKYIGDNNLNIIGEPLPVEEITEQEWKAGNDFKFKFDVALNPEISLTLDKSDEIPFYNVTVSEDDRKKMLEGYKKRQEAVVKAAEEENREIPPVKSDEELEKEVAEQLKNEYKNAAEFRFEKDVREYCLNKSGVKVPEQFLRRWLIAVNKDKFTEEQIDKDFAGFIEDYRWQLVMGYLSKQYDVKVGQDDLLEEAKNFARYQYAMYGIANAPEDALDSFAQNILKDESQVQRMAENVQVRMVIAAVKEKITVKSKKISAEKFRELK